MVDGHFNQDQVEYMESLGKISPHLRCYCGWYRLGECPHCPAGKTCQDKLNDRGNSQPSSVCRCIDSPGSIVPRPTAEADDALGVPREWREKHHD